jgi:hypothetical protein
MTKEKIDLSVDGRAYTKEVENDLNSKAYALFGSGVGKAFLQYLENLTIQNIHSAATPSDQLSQSQMRVRKENKRWLILGKKKLEKILKVD